MSEMEQTTAHLGHVLRSQRDGWCELRVETVDRIITLLTGSVSVSAGEASGIVGQERSDIQELSNSSPLPPVEGPQGWQLTAWLQRRIDEWQDYRDKYPAETCCATARIDTLIEVIAHVQAEAPPLASEGPPPDWQPIATAPKNGGNVMLWCVDLVGGNGRVATGSWREMYNGSWWDYNMEYTLNPTHWMPLPSAPAETGEERS